jgi:hypothetical protein
MGQFGYSRGQIRTIENTLDTLRRCDSMPQKATKGHKRPREATKGHRKPQEQATAETVSDKKLKKATTGGQLWTVWDSLPQKGADGGKGEELGIEGCTWVHSGAIQNKRGHDEYNLGEVMELGRGYWNIKECGDASRDLQTNVFEIKLMAGGVFRLLCATNVPPAKIEVIP